MKGYFCFNRIFAGVVILLLMVTLFFACTKSATDTAGIDTNKADNDAITAATDQAVVRTIYDDLFGIALEICAYNNLNQTGRKAQDGSIATRLPQCYSSDVDDMNKDQWPKTAYVDFGAGCADQTGRVRAGTLEIILNGYFYYPGSVIIIKPVTYTVNGAKVTGNTTITNISTDSSYKYTAVVTDGTVTLDSIMVNFKSNATITQIDGLANMADVADDVFSITGTDSLSYPGGVGASIVVNEGNALERRMDCPWFGKGKALVTVNGVAATVSYGNGVCDDSATIDLGDKVKAIKLLK